MADRRANDCDGARLIAFQNFPRSPLLRLLRPFGLLHPVTPCLQLKTELFRPSGPAGAHS